MIDKKRLSSDYLYHFKRDYNIIKLILKSGFRHNCWAEKIPYKKSVQENFIVCFCDIRHEDAAFHRSVYGNNAIVLTKEWAIRNGISPVRYVHQNSIGISEDYLKFKSKRRTLSEITIHDSQQLIYGLAQFSLMNEKGLLNKDTLDEDMEDEGIKKEVFKIEEEFHEYFKKLKSLGLEKEFNKYMVALGNIEIMLLDELEKRDSHLRIYRDDFRDIRDKILYDEREWRSIKYLSKNDLAKYQYIISTKTPIEKRFLPEKYNIKFNSDDVVAILIEKEEDIIDLKNYLRKETTLVSYAIIEKKIKNIKDWQEA